MLFLINNPVIAFALLVAIGFTVFMGAKVVEEIKMNQLLARKHQQMRVKGEKTGFRFRLAGLTSATLAPIALVAIMVVAGLNPTMTKNDDVIKIRTANDIRQIYLDFSEKLNVNYSGNILTPRTALDGMEMDFMTTTGTNVLTGSEKGYTSSGSDDYSTTNTQVIGVDEMDNVLTDGKYIYAINENQVQISIAYTVDQGPSVLSLYKTFDYSSEACSGEQFYPTGLYVDEERLIVIGNQYLYNCEYYSTEPSVDGDVMIDRYMPYWYSQSSHIKVLVFDKASDFTLQDEYRMNGYFTGTRKIDNDLYIVTNNYIPLNDEEANIDDYLSTYSVNGVEVKARYEDIVYIDGTTPNSFTTFYGINLDTTEIDVETILGDSGYNLYVSNDNIYLVGEVYYFWPLANMIRVDEPVYDYKTAILKISIDNGSVEFSKFGKISGHPLDQFAMDEYEGNLRITTTTGWWGESINNRLYVLNKDLEVVSVLENLGKVSERIQSTRFVGEYAYLVTFLQTDPFYVINLSDPQNPFVEGELEIPGFSSYLQPLNENFMLGIGFGDSKGGTQGLKISVYDITDKSNPVIFDEVIFDYALFGWASSSATYEHKDLLVSLAKGIIALPFSVYEETEAGYSYNSGILVYNFDFENGFSLNGYVKHAENTQDNIYVYKAKFISDYFYTISNKYIKVSTIVDTETILYSTNLKVE